MSAIHHDDGSRRRDLDGQLPHALLQLRDGLVHELRLVRWQAAAELGQQLSVHLQRFYVALQLPQADGGVLQRDPSGVHLSGCQELGQRGIPVAVLNQLHALDEVVLRLLLLLHQRRIVVRGVRRGRGRLGPSRYRDQQQQRGNEKPQRDAPHVS